MTITTYSIIPEDRVVVIDGQIAQNVDMSGIPPNVHAIQWDGLRGLGTIEYNVDPETGELPPPGSFVDAAQYATQVASAEAIIYAANHPVTYYSTINGNTYGGVVYNLGSAIVIYTPDTPQPPNTTTLVPGTPASYQALYWYDGAWVLSSFDPTLALSDAKNVLNTAVAVSATEQSVIQSRIYSPVQFSTAADVTALPTADYPGMSLGEYQTYLNGQVASLQATVNAATATTELYSFDPKVDGNPNP